jgi:predicted RecA/RadA family phage recombinase
MSNRFIQPGKVLDYQNGSTARVSGEVVVIGTKVGICQTAIAANAIGAVMICGVHRLPKVSANTMAQGALVYWNSTDSAMTTTASGNTLAGVAANAAGSGVGEVHVLLNDTPA